MCVYVCKRALEIQSTIFFNTYSRPSANISTASIGRQSGCHHIVFFFAEASVNRAEQTECCLCCFAARGEVVLVMSSKFNGFHPYCCCASVGLCSVLEQ